MLAKHMAANQFLVVNKIFKECEFRFTLLFFFIVMSKKLTNEDFIKKVNNIHQGSIIVRDFTSMKEQAEFECITCGNIWKTNPSKIIYSKHGCSVCGKKKIWQNRKDKTTKETLIERISNIFPQYDLSLIPDNISNQKTKFDVICPKHGKFPACGDTLLHNISCRYCQYGKLSALFRKSKDELIKEANIIHNGFYDYSKVVDDGTETIQTIICPKHGEFHQDFYHHITRKQDCPYCKKSTLENKIRDKLITLNIDFIQSFKDIWLDNLHLDFYLLKYNVAIECQGEQHYRPIKWFGGDVSFAKQQERDNKKLQLCKQQDIKLFYYTQYSPKVDNIVTFNNIENLFNAFL